MNNLVLPLTVLLGSLINDFGWLARYTATDKTEISAMQPNAMQIIATREMVTETQAKSN